MRPNLDDVYNELVAMAQAAGVWSDPEVRQSIEMAVARGNQKRIEFWYRRLEVLLAEDDSMFHPFLPDPEVDDVNTGEIRLGDLVTGGQVAAPLSSLLLNVFIAGPPKQGKSVLTTLIVKQLIEAGVPVHIFDTENEYTDVLAPMFGAGELDIVDVQRLRMDAFREPSTISHTDWINGPLCDALRESLFWRDRTINVFRNLCLDILAKTDRVTAPLFVAEFSRLPAYKKRLEDYVKLDRLVTLFRTIETFHCEDGERIEEVAHRSRVYNLWNVSTDARLFFITFMVAQHKASREFVRDRDLELVMVFDELHQFISKDSVAAKKDLGGTAFQTLLRTSRRWGIGCILADQTYSLVDQVVRTNCQTKIAFQMGDGPSRWEVGRDLSLTREQQDYLRELSWRADNRRAVVKTADYPYPILVEVDHFEKPPAPSREEIRWRQDLVTPPASESEILEVAEPEVEYGVEDGLPDEHHRVLVAVAADPMADHKTHARKIGMPKATFSIRATDLKDWGFLADEVVRTGRQGRQPRILYLTAKGREYLERRNLPYETLAGRGSLEHRWWQNKLLAKFANADVVKTELALRSKQVDVGVIRGDRRLAYEVVVSADLEKELSNVRKDLADGWHRVTFVVVNAELADRLRERLPDDPRLAVKLARDL